MTVYWFILSALAVWRLTHLLGKEDGPLDIIFLMRKKAGAGFFGSLLDCFYCLSIWIAFPFACYIAEGWIAIAITWLALSGTACLLEQATANKDDHGKTEYVED